MSLYHLGVIACFGEDFLRGQTLLDQALAIVRGIGSTLLEGYVLTALCDALEGLGRSSDAVEAGKKAIQLREEGSQIRLALDSRAACARSLQSQGDVSAAEKQVKGILAYLDSGKSLMGTDHPVRIYLTCEQVLSSAGNTRARDMLSAGYALLMTRAAKITDEADRRRYLENVPWHREIVGLWKSRAGEPSAAGRKYHQS